MSRARDLGSLINSTAAGKNYIINGAFDIWQRGISITNGYPIYGADRWMNYGNGNGTMSRQFVSDSTNLPSLRYCARLQRTAGSTSINNLYMSQSIETSNSIPLAGKRLTISYYARKGANFSGNAFGFQNMLVLETVTGTGTDQNCIAGFTGGSSPSGGIVYQIITDTWTRYSATFTMPSNATQIGFNFFFTPAGTAAANDYFEITGIQLEIGNSPTQFSLAGGDIAGELLRCQRYYIKKTPTVSDGYYGTIMTVNTTTTAMTSIAMPVTMRTRPSFTFANLSMLYGSGGNVSISGLQNYSDQLSGTVGLYLNISSAITQGTVGQIYGSGSSYMIFDAEL